MNAGTTITPEQLHLTWETRIRVLTNPSVWTSMLLALGIPSVLLGIGFAVMAKRPEYALLVPLGFMSILLGIFFLVALVIDLFGGFKVVFFLTSQGVRSVAGKGARAASTVAVLAGVLAGKAGAVGAGLLAESEQNVFIPWKDITKIKVKTWRRFIHVKREWGYKPIGLYCTPENFPQVMDILRQYAGDKMPT
ncbi:MAG: hypothetical protein WCI75_16340 [candidate division NC10 bacterium]